MFLPLSFFHVKMILSVFQILLVGAVGAGLALYARIGGEYANSVRWIRQGGYLEMVKTLYNSGKTVPRQAKMAMVVTIIFAPADTDSVYSGWATYIQYGDNIVDAMSQMINDTRKIPEMSSERLYFPRLTNYTIECEDPMIVLHGGRESNTQLTTEGCYYIHVYTPGEPTHQNAPTQPFSSGRWSLSSTALPEEPGVSRFKPLKIDMRRNNVSCATSDNAWKLDSVTDENNGLISMPMT
ncbi:hypothetical protein BGZ65_003865, partial [Modicella reniformis]